MAKNKHKNGASFQNKKNIPTPQPKTDKNQIKQQKQDGNLAFEEASKILNKSLVIQIDQSFLQSIDVLSTAQASTLNAWLSQFVSVCNDLNSYKQNLDEENKARWEACNQKDSENEAQKQSNELENNRLVQLAADLEQEKKQLDKQSAELTTKDRALFEREKNAELGFDKQNREALERLKKQQDEEKTEYCNSLETLKNQKKELFNEIEKAKVTLLAVERESQAALDEKEIALAQSIYDLSREKDEFDKNKDLHELEKRSVQTNLDLENAQIKKQWEELAKAQENLDALVDKAMERERLAYEKEKQKLDRQLEKAWNKVEDFKTKLLDFEDLEHALAGQSIDDFMQQLENLKQENAHLKHSSFKTDHQELERQNDELRSLVNSLETKLKDMRPKLEKAEQEVSQNRIAATQLSSVEQQRKTLQYHKELLEVHIDDLANRINLLTDAHKTQTPFPAMSNMDKAKDFQASMELEPVPELEEFAHELQHRIAQAEKIKLYYPLGNIRILIAGLAMSQLHVFQGISGTGKTSLAKAFAKAMGGFCTDIAVQAGWRDRDDLLGHYNAFERRYYEKDCLQALYQAQTPRWKDTCNIILLDEMNLSRPEQYFSEFLSALEKNDANERLISLSETALPNAPKNLIQGRQILVPQNIWFIGTLNQDETTNELADKTYDRSHIMTLPRQEQGFEIKQYPPTSYSLYSLNKRLNEAVNKYAKEVETLLSKVAKDNFTTMLAKTFELGWGNRFERQAKRFIPAMLACGATKDQALDHLFATRVMRHGKVTGRYDISADNINDLKDSLEKFWKIANLEGQPSKSFELLNADLQRKERK